MGDITRVTLPHELEFNIQGDTISINIQCENAYAAQSLFEDMMDRFAVGETITLRNKGRED